MRARSQDGLPLSVSIRLSQPKVASLSGVKLFIAVTNRSQNDVELDRSASFDGHAEDVNKIEVRDDSGKLLQRIIA